MSTPTGRPDLPPTGRPDLPAADRGRGSVYADLASAAVVGGGFVVFSLVLALTTRSFTLTQAVALLVLVGLYALAFRSMIIHSGGGSVPTEPVLVAMLFLLPLPMVPLAVLASCVCSEWPRNGPPKRVVRDLLLCGQHSWHSAGPVLVLLAAGPSEPSLRHWPLYLAALAAQFAFDLVSAEVRAYWVGRSLAGLRRPLVWTFQVDILLAVIGFAMVVTGRGTLATAALVAVPILLFRLLTRDGKTREDMDGQVAKAEREARIDSLTGLGNHRAWREAVEDAQLLVGENPQLRVGVLICDLDQLKVANDSLGHDVGDALIRALADAARAAIPAHATLCRIGGDEFGILVPGPIDVRMVAHSLQQRIEGLDRVRGVRMSATIGMAEYPTAASVADAIVAADHLLLAEKRMRNIVRATLHGPRAAPVSESFDAAPDRMRRSG